MPFSLDILTDCKTKTDCLVLHTEVHVKQWRTGEEEAQFVIVQTQTSCLAKLNCQATVSGFMVAISTK